MNVSVNFKPSEIVLFRSAFPLINVFGRAELEMAAALIIIACRRNGDSWSPLEPRAIGYAMEVESLKGGLLYDLSYHPMAPSADFEGLVRRGFAASTLKRNAPITFTQKGFDALRRAVVKPS